MAYKKRFWIVLVALIGIPVLVLLASIGIYRFNFTNADIYMELADGEVVQYDDLMREIEEHGYSKVMLSLFSIRTKEDLRIQLPEQPAETPVWVPLRNIDSQATHRSAVGDYTLAEESGTVALSYDTVQALNPVTDKQTAENQHTLFIAPFSVSDQGTGLFYYLGLFEQDNQKMSVHHRDSFLLGNRVNIVSIQPDNQGRSVTVEYMERNTDSNAGFTPQQPVSVTVNVATDPVRFSVTP
ncbi:hypothetical protein [Neptunomonas sp.]|uniref:hypothetical protein n=1 Tax=Neptunomonas sp. TaxID=1971898 RepID=UPI0035650593